jgi:hypothetical protein
LSFPPHVQIWHNFSFPHVQIRHNFSFLSFTNPAQFLISCTNLAQFLIPGSSCTNLALFVVPSSCTHPAQFFFHLFMYKSVTVSCSLLQI